MEQVVGLPEGVRVIMHRYRGSPMCRPLPKDYTKRKEDS